MLRVLVILAPVTTYKCPNFLTLGLLADYQQWVRTELWWIASCLRRYCINQPAIQQLKTNRRSTEVFYAFYWQCWVCCRSKVVLTMTASCCRLARILVLLMAAAAAAAGLTSADSERCPADSYFDQVAQQCTPCTEICDPGRGTVYLCLKHIDVCNGKL